MDISDALPHPTGAEPSVVPVVPATDTPVAHAPETVQHVDLTEPPSTTDVTAAAELSVDVPPVDAPPLVDAPPIVEMPAIVDVPPAEDVPAIVDAVPAAPAAEAAPARPVLTDEQKKAQQDALRARAQEAWQRVVDARESGTVLSGRVTAVVKGGLLVDVGSIRGFLPASQVRAPEGGTLDALVRTKLDLKVIDVDASRRRIVVSNRRAVEEARRNKRSEILRELAVGQTRSATVVRLTDFGAFVDLGGVDGLIPMSELAFERVDKAADVVTVGETLNVVVMRIDENGKKISLSRKNALPDPWRDHADIVRQGVTVEGKVVGKEPRLMVEIAPGVVGSVRENDADPAQYEIGEAIEVSVRFVDRRTRRITLTTLHAADVSTRPPTSSGFAPLGIELGRR